MRDHALAGAMEVPPKMDDIFWAKDAWDSISLSVNLEGGQLRLGC